MPALYVPGFVLLAVQIVTLQFFAASARLLVEFKSRPLGLSDSFLCISSGRFVAQLPAGRHADPASAVEVDHARDGAGDYALHRVLRAALFVRHDAVARDEGHGAFARPAAADVRLCHRPLPVDGRRPDLQARHGLHAGCRGNCRRIFCGRRRHRRTRTYSRAKRRTARPDGRNRRHGAPLRSGAQVHSGEARPVLLPHSLRLPANAGGIRPRAEFRDRSGQDAVITGRSAYRTR